MFEILKVTFKNKFQFIYTSKIFEKIVPSQALYDIFFRSLPKRSAYNIEVHRSSTNICKISNRTVTHNRCNHCKDLIDNYKKFKKKLKWCSNQLF